MLVAPVAAVVGAAVVVAEVGAAVAGAALAAGVVAAVGAAAGAVVAAALPAGFAVVAVVAAAVGAVLAVAAGVCAWTADAKERIPANADDQTALLKRITTLSRLRIGKEVRGFPDSKNTKLRSEPQAPRAASSTASLLPAKSDFHTSSRGCTSGGTHPRGCSSTARPDAREPHSDCRRSATPRAATADPRDAPLTNRRSRLPSEMPGTPDRPTVRRNAHRRRKPAVSCGKPSPRATFQEPDRTADRTPPWDVLVGQLPRPHTEAASQATSALPSRRRE